MSDQLYCFVSQAQLSELDLSQFRIDHEDEDSDDEPATAFDFSVQRTSHQEEGIHLAEESRMVRPDLNTQQGSIS